MAGEPEQMTSFERDVIDRLGRIETKLDADFRALHGNGRPGLIDKHTMLEDRVQVLEDQHKSESKHLGLVAVVVGFLINGAISVYGAFFKN